MMQRNLGWGNPEGAQRDYEALVKRLAREDEERANAESQKLSKSQTQTSTQTQAQTSITITQTADFWEVDGVEYRNGIHSVQLAKALLDNGASKTQDDWAEYSIKANKQNSFYTPDMPLSHALFTALSKSQTNEAQEAREFIKTQMRTNWLMTLTRIVYQPSGKDKIIHNYGIPNEKYEIDSNFVGKDGFIADAKITPIQYLEDLIGAKDAAEINKVYQSINGTDAYIYRVNSKPKNIDERVAGFIADSDGAVFDCYRIPACSSASLGVRFASLPQQAKQRKKI